MIERNLMISGLTRQRNLLAGLIAEIERKPRLSLIDAALYQDRTRKVAENLRKLRKIKNSYTVSTNPPQELWMMHSGISPKANLPMSEVGFYTDFT